MKPLPRKWLRFRITLLLCLFSFLFLIVLARAYQLQVLQSHKLASLAERQVQRAIPLVPRRGILYDRKKEEMAISVEMDSVFAQPAKVGNVEEAAKRVSPILNKSSQGLLKKMKEGKPFVWLERGITASQRQAIEKLDLEGVDFLKETKRFYPQGEIGSCIIGFAGLDSQGLEGVELKYDDFIKGEPGYILISKDALGRSLTPEDPRVRRSEEGCEVILTIDKNIQYITERELKKAVQACSAKGGMAVVMSPKTGEILAMAVQPSFDPNHFSLSPVQVKKNRNITDTFEPGSTFKIFLLAAVLEEGVCSPGDPFFCENGVYPVGGKVIHDVHKYGWLSLQEIIKFSSNIGASKVGRKLGRGKLHQYLKGFGFSGKTGIDLPGEVTGFLAAPQYWSEIGAANICFGQGISLTALQLSNALSVIANGGWLMKPYVVKTIHDRQGNVLKENHPKRVRRVISEKTARTVAAIMRTVCEEGGTGRAAALAGYDAAGKTGTAQKVAPQSRGYSDKRVGSFIGFAPVDDPQVVISVIIDEPRGVSYGGVVATPAFKGIGEQILPYMGVYPKGITYLAKATPGKLPDEHGLVQTSAVQAAEVEVFPEPGIMPDFSGKSIRQVVRISQRLGLDLKLVGSGKAVAQSPEPGHVFQGEAKGMVKFQPTI